MLPSQVLSQKHWAGQGLRVLPSGSPHLAWQHCLPEGSCGLSLSIPARLQVRQLAEPESSSRLDRPQAPAEGPSDLRVVGTLDLFASRALAGQALIGEASGQLQSVYAEASHLELQRRMH